MSSLLNAVRSVAVVGWCSGIALLSGCAVNMPVPIKDATPSAGKYAAGTQVSPSRLSFEDQQTAETKAQLLSGRIPMHPMYNEKPLDAAAWIERNTVKELQARGLPVELVSAGQGNANVQIKHIHIENHRVSGFSPFETYTSLSADVVGPKGTQRVASWIKRGKVPVWSFDEVIEPTFNEPLSVIAKELAAKINQRLFGQAITDAQVDALVTKIESAKSDSAALTDVYELGFGNNSRAIPALVKLANHSDGDVSRAAISSLGTLQAQEQFPLLKQLFETSKGDWEDRATALKAICDLGTPAAKDYVRRQKEKFAGGKDRESGLYQSIIALYQ